MINWPRRRLARGSIPFPSRLLSYFLFILSRLLSTVLSIVCALRKNVACFGVSAARLVTTVIRKYESLSCFWWPFSFLCRAISLTLVFRRQACLRCSLWNIWPQPTAPVGPFRRTHVATTRFRRFLFFLSFVWHFSMSTMPTMARICYHFLYPSRLNCVDLRHAPAVVLFGPVGLESAGRKMNLNCTVT